MNNVTFSQSYVILYFSNVINFVVINLILINMMAIEFVFIGFCLFFAGQLQAQISVNIQLGSAPQWGPEGYPEVQYYYLPDVEAYYNVQTSMFIYFREGNWIHRKQLPTRYKNYDLYNGYKVVMTDYHGNTPYIHFKEYKLKYKKGYRDHGQKTIGKNQNMENTNQRIISTIKMMTNIRQDKG